MLKRVFFEKTRGSLYFRADLADTIIAPQRYASSHTQESHMSVIIIALAIVTFIATFSGSLMTGRTVECTYGREVPAPINFGDAVAVITRSDDVKIVGLSDAGAMIVAGVVAGVVAVAVAGQINHAETAFVSGVFSFTGIWAALLCVHIAYWDR